MKWEKTTIGEHCVVTSSKRFHLSERSKDGIPFYCSKEIIQKCKGEEITDCDHIREDFYNEVSKKFGVPKLMIYWLRQEVRLVYHIYIGL